MLHLKLTSSILIVISILKFQLKVGRKNKVPIHIQIPIYKLLILRYNKTIYTYKLEQQIS